MKLGAPHHASIAVSDLDASLAFYRDGLGLRAVAEFTFDDEGHQVYLGLPVGASGRAVALRTDKPPAAGLTLCECDPQQPRPEPLESLAPGTVMLAFELEDPAEVDSLYESLAAAGYSALSPPDWAEVKGFGQIRGVAIRDPDGLLIELYAPEPPTDA